MEINKVTISTKEYLRLTTFEREMHNKRFARDESDMGYYYYSESEVIETLNAKIYEFRKKNNALHEKLGWPIYKYYYSNADEIRKWSILKFLSKRREFSNDFKRRMNECAEAQAFK